MRFFKHRTGLFPGVFPGMKIKVDDSKRYYLGVTSSNRVYCFYQDRVDTWQDTNMNHFAEVNIASGEWVEMFPSNI